MSEAIVRAEDLRNVRHRFDADAIRPMLTISWEDGEGSHSLTLQDADALSAGAVLFSKRGDEARAEYLKQIVCDERL